MRGQGWEAIQARLTSVYPGQEPKHWGTVKRYSEGGPDPLDGVSAYRAANPPHWHYVTFGFSELGEKTSANLEESGWGIELSFHLKAKPGEAEPPLWPVVMLQKLARFVFGNRTPFDDDHYIAFGAPITKDERTILEAMVFRIDPQLGEIETPNGKVKFIQAIGITSDEHKVVAAADGAAAILPKLLRGNQAGVVDMGRKSVLT